jgi:hypothetical protein
MSDEEMKHLEFIQSIITRMNANSFLLKGWSITITAALLALYAGGQNAAFIVIAIIPMVIFWFLDTYYLQQERQFRGIYNDVAGLTGEADKIQVRLFEMPLQKYQKKYNKKYGYWNVFLSKTLSLFYLPQIILLGIGSFILSGILCRICS